MVKWNDYKARSFQVKQSRDGDPYIMKYPECCGVMILADIYSSPPSWEGFDYFDNKGLAELLKSVEEQAKDDTHRRSAIQLFLSIDQNNRYTRELKKHGYKCFISFKNKNTRSMNYGYIKDLTKVKKAKTKRIFA